jgi:hypothetical protein
MILLRERKFLIELLKRILVTQDTETEELFTLSLLPREGSYQNLSQMVLNIQHFLISTYTDLAIARTTTNNLHPTENT